MSREKKNKCKIEIGIDFRSKQKVFIIIKKKKLSQKKKKGK